MKEHHSTKIEPSLGSWGRCRTIKLLAGGHRNDVLLVERRGELLVAKRTRRNQQAIAWLEDVHAAARQAGFVVPSFVPSERGELQVGNVTVETWIEGRPATPLANALLSQQTRP